MGGEFWVLYRDVERRKGWSIHVMLRVTGQVCLE